MKEVYSKIDPKLLLHLFCKVEDIEEGRNRISPSTSFLCVSVAKHQSGHTGGPHAHLIHNRTSNLTQETFIVIKGKIKVSIYDLDDSFIESEILGPGECHVFLGKGGHNIEVLSDDTVFYEAKNGPYAGRGNDKRDL